ncbi:hypothetical protein QZH41_014261 [Actinostola sp. cb2023]|nr:hypothetical protein QZH41_014261 [Actinostola sp. cb2023]
MVSELSLEYNPSGVANRCFYQCLARFLTKEEDEIVKTLESFMLANQFIPMNNEDGKIVNTDMFDFLTDTDFPLRGNSRPPTWEQAVIALRNEMATHPVIVSAAEVYCLEIEIIDWEGPEPENLSDEGDSNLVPMLVDSNDDVQIHGPIQTNKLSLKNIPGRCDEDNDDDSIALDSSSEDDSLSDDEIFKGYYQNNLSLPIFKNGTKMLPQERKVEALLSPHPTERTCQVVPTNISNNVTFLLDATKLNSWADWKCDDMGAWRNNGVKRTQFSHKDGHVTALRKRGRLNSGNVYTLVRIYYKNKTSPDLKKSVSYLEGLVDSDSADDFYAKLASLKDVWDDREKPFLNRNQKPSFFSYINEKAHMIIENMLADVRTIAGLGSPPSPFYTNVPESANAVIKRAFNFKESEMASFCLRLSQLIKQQMEDVRGALINKGPYKLDENYTHLQLTQEKWFAMSVKQRQAYQAKFDKANQEPECIPHTSEDQNEMECSLSITAEQAQLVSIPLQSVKSVFQKAQLLLSKANSIVQAPGSGGMAFMVESHTSKRPHYVSLEKTTGKVTCENCPGWASAKLCAHAVAAAEKVKKLDSYLEWVRRRGKYDYNGHLRLKQRRGKKG